MKQLVSLISRCVFVGALLILAPDHVPPPAHTPMTAPAPPSTRARTTPMLYTHTLRGASVRTPDGISLGVLGDLVLDPADARIVMVIVVAGGRFGLGGRFIALPWGLVQPVEDETALIMLLPLAPLRFPRTEEGLEEASD